jgi:Zn ribbon nucleic-acid-binding protein
MTTEKQVVPEVAEHLSKLKAAGFSYAMCPHCQIIFSLASAWEVECLEKLGCGNCCHQQEAKRRALSYYETARQKAEVKQ